MQDLNNNELYLAISVAVCIAVCWVTMFLVIKEKKEILAILFGEGNFLRILAVVSIVAAVAYLTATNRFGSSEAATIFSGIAGYVLGGISKKNQ